MARAIRLALLLATLWPLMYIAVFLAFLVGTFNEPSANDGSPEGWMFILPLHMLTMLWVIALLAVYIVNVYRNEGVPADKKPLWATMIFFGTVVVMPIYWYLYIWNTGSEPQRSATSQGDLEAPR